MFNIDFSEKSFVEDFKQHLSSYNGNAVSFEPDIVDVLPPSSLEAEEKILGAFLFAPVNALHVLEIPDDVFFTPSNRLLFRIIKFFVRRYPEEFNKVKDGGTKLDSSTSLFFLIKEIIEKFQLEHNLSSDYLMHLIDCTISAHTATIDFYIRVLLDKYYRRKMIAEMKKMSANCYDPTQSLEEIIAGVQDTFEQVSMGMSKMEGFSDMQDALSAIFDTYHMAANGEIIPNVPTGFYDLDSLIGGGLRTGYNLIAARTSMGKSAFALQLAHSVAKQGSTVAYYSLEMPKEDLVRRLISAEAKISSDQIRNGTIPEAQIPDFFRVSEDLSSLPLYIYDQPSLSCNALRVTLTNLHKMKAKTEAPLKLAIIDYIGLFEEMYDKSGNPAIALGAISRNLKKLSAELGIPIIALVQINRSCEGRNDKRPMLSELRQSGALEQDADSVMLLYRDEYYNPETVDRGVMEINVAKHRNGQTGTIKLGYDAQFTRMFNLARRTS